MTAAPQWNFVTEDDYLAAEIGAEMKREFIGGVVYAMAGAKIRHNRIAGNAFAIFHNALRGSACSPFNSDTKVRIRLRDHTRFYYPDAMVVCDSNPDDDTFQDEPVIIVEVASESTRRIDEGEKKDAYLSIPSLGSYLVVDQETPVVLAYQRQPDTGFRREIFEGLDAIIPLPEIGSELDLSDLYEGVTLEGFATPPR